MSVALTEDNNHSCSAQVQHPPSRIASAHVPQLESSSNRHVRTSVPMTEQPITHKISSAEGIVQRVRALKSATAIGLLAAWSHPRREREVNDELLTSLRTLPMEEAVGIVAQLKSKEKKFVKGRKGNQLEVSAQIQTLDTQKRVETHVLIDSGCTGCCIDEDFVRRHKINTEPIPYPVPVYNADGTLNSGGMIRRQVRLRVVLGDHEETLLLGVTKLGDIPIFLGHSWLITHNPTIDWTKNTILFDRCPEKCHHMNLHASLDVTLPDEYLRRMEMQYWQEETIRKLSELDPKEWAEIKDQIPKYLHDYADVFSEQMFSELPERRPWDHAIDLKPDAKLGDCKVYPLNPQEDKALDEFLAENLKTGRIRPSKSPIASPFFFVKKKDGKLRPVQDYRKLNDATIKNKYPLPLIQELIDKIKDAKIFSKMDIRWGYNNIRIREGDEYKAAFRTNKGLFEPTVMFFGLTNSPATFQNFMNDILHDLIMEGSVIVYMDDILIFSDTLQEHRHTVKRVLDILRQHNLSLKPSKCEFEKDQVEFLGLLVGNGVVRMDPKKVQAIQDWPVPTTKKQLQAFLGFCNFYRRFIRNFSAIAKPLTSLTGKVEWSWGEAQEQAFQKLKQKISEEVVLLIPRAQGRFRVEADSSDYATGAVLSQLVNSKWYPVAFLSKSLNEAERNYEIYDKEMLAIMHALEEWRQYLMGNPDKFEIWSDHQNLQYFRQPQKLNRRQARWLTELADYDFELIHKPGSQMTKADLLSRRADLEKGEKDNSNVILLKSELFRNLSFNLLDQELLTEIKDHQRKMDKVIQNLLDRKDSRLKQTEDGLILYEDLIYIPRHLPLREKIMKLHHDSTLAGHPGIAKTLELITRNYWWPGIRGYVKKYTQGCRICQETKVKRGSHAPLQPNAIPSQPWEIISIDLVGPLPRSQGYDMICVIVDRFTKMIKVIPTTSSVTSEGVARIFRDNVFRSHGIPRIVISDRGPQFVSKFMQEFFRMLNITGNPSTAFHPQTDGQTERINQEIEQYLRIYINHAQDDWAEWISLAEFTYNNHQHSSTGYSPFYLYSGHHPNMATGIRRESSNESVDHFINRMKKIREDAQSALKKAADTMKRFYDRGEKEQITYQPGDKVWLEAENITPRRPARKLTERRLGPFTVLSKVGKSAYKLKIPASWKIHPVFNEVLLTPYREPQFQSQKSTAVPLPPEIIEGVEEYEVEEIIDSRMHRGRLEYLVHWKGYPKEDRTWEPSKNLTHAKNLVSHFHQTHPSAPRPVNFTQVRFKSSGILEDGLIPVSRQVTDWEYGRYLGEAPSRVIHAARDDQP